MEKTQIFIQQETIRSRKELQKEYPPARRLLDPWGYYFAWQKRLRETSEMAHDFAYNCALRKITPR